MKLLLRNLVLCIFAVMTQQAFADIIEAPSTITSVTVYPGAAHLTRTVSLDLNSGDHTIILDKIIPPLDENTLAVSGEGTAAVKVYGGYIKQETLKQSQDFRVKDLQQKIQDIDDTIIILNSNAQVLDQKKEYLASIKLFAAGQLPKDLMTTMPSVESLKGVGNYLTDEFISVEKQKDAIRVELRGLNNERVVLQTELNRVWSNANNTQRRLAVDLNCTKPGKFKLHVAYLINGVNWRPLYDARTNFEKSAIELTSFGVVQQKTGEDWTDISLTLSTAKPNLGGRMPYVSSWILQPFQPRRRDEARQNFGYAAKLGMALESDGQVATMSNGITDKLKESSVVAAEIAFSDVAQKGLSVTYKIPRLASVKSDGTENKFPIATQSLKSEFQYSSYPKASPYSYLNSDVYNSNDLQLLSGQVNLFLEGDFIGKSNIESVSPGEKFSIYLGVNENVKVKREQISKKVDDVFMLGIPSPNKTTTVKMKITIENYESRTIKYNLFESMPITENDKQIKVKIIDVSLEPVKKDWEDRKGVWQWVVELKPKAKQEISYTFVVEHPRDMQVGGI